MRASYVLLAVNSRGVTEDRKVLSDVDIMEFELASAAFKKQHPGLYMVFFSEDELNHLSRDIIRQRTKI